MNQWLYLFQYLWNFGTSHQLPQPPAVKQFNLPLMPSGPSPGNDPLRFLSYAFVHSAKTFGYIPAVLFLLAKYPKKGFSAMLMYYFVRFNSDWWCRFVHDFTAYGSSPEPVQVRRQTKPFDTSKKYILSGHPHGLLSDGLFNLVARKEPNIHERSTVLVDGLAVAVCVAKEVKYMPFWGEMFRNKVTDVDGETLRRLIRDTDISPALLPGGFSEAVYVGADPVVEHCFIEGRMGMFKIAITEGIDIIPQYTYGLNDMYRSMDWKRHERAVLAQKTGIPTVIWWGKWGTNIPFREDLSWVTFDPFPASKYTIDQIEQCAEDYKKYLLQCYDSYKHEAGYGHRRLEFIGKNVPHKPLNKWPSTGTSSATIRSKL